MIFIEFQKEFNYGTNILKYRNIDDDSWYYMYIDLETLNLLVQNYGVYGTIQYPTISRNIDNPSSGKDIKINYCGTEINLHCGNNYNYYSILDKFEQNY